MNWLQTLLARLWPLLQSTRFGVGFVLGGLFMWMVATGTVRAHEFTAGSIAMVHPYATPSAGTTGAVYFRSIRNRSEAADRLVAASSPVATRVGLHTMSMDGNVMRMREVQAIELPPRSETKMGHAQNSGYHLMLEGLKAPLKDGDRFDLTLRFEKAGERTVQIWVQTPRGTAAHKH
jgi:periplasmic copper chaperone A